MSILIRYDIHLKTHTHLFKYRYSFEPACSSKTDKDPLKKYIDPSITGYVFYKIWDKDWSEQRSCTAIEHV